MEDNKVTTKKASLILPKKVERRSEKGDRRKMPSKGLAYISVVGWICRREKCRRKDDKLNFF
jgi:hypothetical protein